MSKSRQTDRKPTKERIRRRLRHDLHLTPDTVDGVMTIIDEELAPVDDVLEDWACDVCGENPSTVTRLSDGQSKCNECLFGDD